MVSTTSVVEKTQNASMADKSLFNDQAFPEKSQNQKDQHRTKFHKDKSPAKDVNQKHKKSPTSLKDQQVSPTKDTGLLEKPNMEPLDNNDARPHRSNYRGTNYRPNYKYNNRYANNTYEQNDYYTSSYHYQNKMNYNAAHYNKTTQVTSKYTPKKTYYENQETARDTHGNGYHTYNNGYHSNQVVPSTATDSTMDHTPSVDQNNNTLQYDSYKVPKMYQRSLEISLVKELEDSEPEQRRKLFIGGLSYETDDKTLFDHFSRYGELTDCVVMKDPRTKRSRGFGFVCFLKSDMLEKCMEARPHYLNDRPVEPKRAVSRLESAKPGANLSAYKLYVSGFKLNELSTDDFRGYFEKYGRINSIDFPKNKETGEPRNFAFIIFDDYDVVDVIIADAKKIVTERPNSKKLDETKLSSEDKNTDSIVPSSEEKRKESNSTDDKLRTASVETGDTHCSEQDLPKSPASAIDDDTKSKIDLETQISQMHPLQFRQTSVAHEHVINDITVHVNKGFTSDEYREIKQNIAKRQAAAERARLRYNVHNTNYPNQHQYNNRNPVTSHHHQQYQNPQQMQQFYPKPAPAQITPHNGRNPHNKPITSSYTPKDPTSVAKTNAHDKKPPTPHKSYSSGNSSGVLAKTPPKNTYGYNSSSTSFTQKPSTIPAKNPNTSAPMAPTPQTNGVPSNRVAAGHITHNPPHLNKQSTNGKGSRSSPVQQTQVVQPAQSMPGYSYAVEGHAYSYYYPQPYNYANPHPDQQHLNGKTPMHDANGYHPTHYQTVDHNGYVQYHAYAYQEAYLPENVQPSAGLYIPPTPQYIDQHGQMHYAMPAQPTKPYHTNGHHHSYSMNRYNNHTGKGNAYRKSPGADHKKNNGNQKQKGPYLATEDREQVDSKYKK